MDIGAHKKDIGSHLHHPQYDPASASPSGKATKISKAPHFDTALDWLSLRTTSLFAPLQAPVTATCSRWLSRRCSPTLLQASTRLTIGVSTATAGCGVELFRVYVPLVFHISFRVWEDDDHRAALLI